MKIKILIIMALAAISVNYCFSQSNGLWSAGGGNDTVKTKRFVEMKNSAKVNGILAVDSEIVAKKIVTDSIYASSFTVESQNISGNLKSDSLTVTGGAHIFGPLHVGSHSLTLQGLGSSTSDDITSDHGIINLGGSPTFSDIRLGVGKIYPQYMVDVNGDLNIESNQSYRIAGAPVLTNKGGQNILVGDYAGYYNVSGSSNSFIGYSAGLKNNSGTWNSFVGTEAGYKNETGSTNTYMGSQAGYSNINGNSNSFVGYSSGYNNTGNNNNGSWNSFFGSYSGYNNTIGQSNSFFGNGTGYKNTTGIENSFFGNGAGYANIDGYSNSFFGYDAGKTNTTGSFNTYIGYKADGSANLQNATAIGYNAIVNAHNSMVLGNGVNVGIGTSTPKNLSHLNGTTTAIYTQYTNNSTTATDAYKGFKVGIDASGNAQLIQNLNKNMLFYTNTSTTTSPAERMRITYNGNIGLGTFTDALVPKRKVDIYDNSRPQLRLSNTLNTSAAAGVYTDLQTTAEGDLYINPRNGIAARYVGIGTIAPTQTLDLNGNLRVRQLDAATTNLGGIIAYENNTAGKEGSLHKIAFDPLNANKVLHGDGSWSEITGGGTASGWSGAGTGQMFATNLNDKIAIGATSSSSYTTKLYVHNTTEQNSALFVNDATNLPAGISPIGLQFYVLESNGDVSNGIVGETTSINPNSRNWGIYSEANGQGDNTGLLSIATGSGVAIGIKAIAGNGTINYAGWFDGNINCNGNTYSTGETWSISDSRIKDNIQSVSNALQTINLMQPHYYTMRTAEYPYLNLPEGNQYGLIADELSSVVPELVKDVTQPAQYDKDGNELSPEITYKALNYTGLIPITIQGIKELDTRVTDLENTGASNNSGWSGAGTGQMFATNVNDKIAFGTTGGNAKLFIKSIANSSLNFLNIVDHNNNEILKIDDTGIVNIATEIHSPAVNTIPKLQIGYNKGGIAFLASQFPDVCSTIYERTDGTYNNSINISSRSGLVRILTRGNDYHETDDATLQSQYISTNILSSKNTYKALVIRGTSTTTNDSNDGIEFQTWNNSSNIFEKRFWIQNSFNTNNTSAIFNNLSSVIINGISAPINQDPSISYKFYVNGYTGNLDGAWHTGSDSILKKDIQPFEDGLNVIRQIKPVSFLYNGLAGLSSNKRNISIIAQDIIQVAPYTIDTSSVKLHDEDSLRTDILTYNSGPLLYASINAIKQLDSTINDNANITDSLENIVLSMQSLISNLQSQVSSYETRFNYLDSILNECCKHDNGNHGNGNNGNAKSTEVNSVINITPDNSISKKETVLEQNVPNPFTVKTTFNYTIGTKGNVELEIMTYSGQYVTTLVNTNQEEGSYSIDWNTSNIAPGIYFYTLRVDGVEWVKKAIRIK